MRDRLIELLKEADEKTFKESLRKKEKADLYECTATYLLANGVIVPPCKVGDRVWYIEEMKSYLPSYHTWYECLSFEIEYIEITEKWTAFGVEGSGMLADHRFYTKDLGEYVFLTKEEAEAKLKELKGE